MERQLIDIKKIKKLNDNYPENFIKFCKKNNLNYPGIKSGNGIALNAMLSNMKYYWNRDQCDKFVKRFKINTNDSIQLFNKHNQWGIKTSSGNEKGKYYIVFPYCLSNKHRMRKNFKFDGTKKEKNKEIDNIKSTIKADYIDVDNHLWQLGHKNPHSIDNTNNNLILQPPIQGKYRDDYIFIDTLTKFPTPNKFRKIIKNKEINFTKEQIIDYKDLFDKII